MIGLFAIILIGIMLYMLDMFTELGAGAGRINYQFILSLTLLLLMIIVGVNWIIAVNREVLIFKYFFSDYLIEFPKILLVSILVSMGIALGLLCFVSDRLLLFNIIYIGYKLIELLGMRKLKQSVYLPLAGRLEKSTFTEGRSKYLKIILDYLLERPHMKRTLYTILGSVAAIVFIVLDMLKPVNIPFMLIAYIVTILDIAINEFMINYWRSERNQALFEHGEYYK